MHPVTQQPGAGTHWHGIALLLSSAPPYLRVSMGRGSPQMGCQGCVSCASAAVHLHMHAMGMRHLDALTAAHDDCDLI